MLGLAELSEDDVVSIETIFPSINKYRNEHNTINLQKLCTEIAEFCSVLYASTQSDEERKVFKAMVEKLNK